MAKYYGSLGFVETVETTPGIWKEVITERKYSGDVIKAYKRSDSSDKINDDIQLNNQISIVYDAYAYNTIYALKYLEWLGVKWKVVSVDVQPPRLLLTVGGIYHGE